MSHEDMLARWRQKYGPCWRVTLVVDGHDEVFERWYPGNLSRAFVSRVAPLELARQRNFHIRFVTLTKLEREA